MLGYCTRIIKIKHILSLIGAVLALYIFQTSFLQKHDPNVAVLLWWTPFTGDDAIITCRSQKCLLTNSRDYINSSNLKALLFYGSQFNIHDVPIPKRHPWALFHEESPRNVAVFLHNRTYDLFDQVATFSRYSDLPLTLQYLESLNVITTTKYLVALPEKNKMLDRIAPVLYIQSDCDTPVERDAYVKELMEYIKVDSYGACLKNKDLPPSVASVFALDLYNEEFLKFMATYKFIIAFENAVCDDYITEKLWRPLMVGNVPIYLGSPSVRDWLPNENSAILAEDFPTPKLLAQYILKVNSNDTLYQQYFEHKRGVVANDLLKNAIFKGSFGITTDLHHPIPAFECFVCENIQNGVQKIKRTESMFNCPRPDSNSWRYHWDTGACQSKALVNLVENMVKIEEDTCQLADEG